MLLEFWEYLVDCTFRSRVWTCVPPIMELNNLVAAGYFGLMCDIIELPVQFKSFIGQQRALRIEGIVKDYGSGRHCKIQLQRLAHERFRVHS